MKVRVTFKEPDAIGDAVNGAVKAWALERPGLDAEEIAAVSELRAEKVRKAISTWVKWGEYVDVEFDIEAGTASVLRAGEE